MRHAGCRLQPNHCLDHFSPDRADGIFDDQDNCPLVANADQVDSDEDGVADEDPSVDIPAAGAQVLVSIYDSNDTDLNNSSNIWNFIGTTDEQGIYRTPWYKSPEGDYWIEVSHMSLSGHAWDTDIVGVGLEDDDEDGDGLPDLAPHLF